MDKELSLAELDDQSVELLPDRETLYFNSYNWANVMATNSSLAMNASTLLSAANSAAGQTIIVNQF